MRMPPASTILLGLIVGLGAAERDPRVGDVDPVLPRDKLERALNGTMGFPPTPAAWAAETWTADATGFAADRLFRVPAAGVHPRILFAPEDLPRIRRHLASDEAAKGVLAGLRALLATGIATPGTREEQLFTPLAAGDLAGFATAIASIPLEGAPPAYGFRFGGVMPGSATRWGPRNALLASLEAQALVALVDDDAVAGKRVATAVATYAAYLAPIVDALNALPRHENHFESTRLYVTKEVAYGYDWAWPWMTPEQRDAVRGLLVRSTVGKYTLGMDLPAHWRRWNFIGMTEPYTTSMFAIEGEAGDDPRGRARMFEVYRDFLTHGTDALGMGTEGIGYHTSGLHHIGPAMLAFANRGENLMTHPHWRRLVDTWLVHAMQPFGQSWQTSGDLGNFPPNISMMVLHQFYYPGVPGVDAVYRNLPLVAKQAWADLAANGNEAVWLLTTVAQAEDTLGQAQVAAAARVAKPGGSGLTFHDPRRGSMYTRTGWGSDALVVHVDGRIDTPYASHDHADRGQFTLAALGRAWACDGYRDSEGKYHNLVTIDGRGQGFFPTPCTWIGAEDTPQATTGIIDARNCWDWQWTKSLYLESKQSLEHRGQASAFAVASALRLQSRIPVEAWEVDPSPLVTSFFSGFAGKEHGDPRMWADEDGWQVRARWFPVQKAFRSVTLARGRHPYVLVVDDLRKDDQEHLYEWRMNAPPDVSAVSISGSDILLGDRTTTRKPSELRDGFQGATGLVPAKGDRLLLVRTLDIAGPDLPTLQPIPMVAAIEYRKTDDQHQFFGRSMGMGTQVVIGSRSVEPRFVVLLFPHRHGEEVPTTTWSADRSSLTIVWKDQTDRYAVTTTADGRRVFTLQR